ncbi:protein piccolo-like [Penaeus monodon]|uniref:protein piccolo-like n=1 Tax=Penaeus monodon TaxID=6687 RepID=UPI0018A7D40A|nr:protein piccolo-like [Penaeus monodon]
MSVTVLFIFTLILPVITASGCPSNYVPLDRTCVQVVIAARKGEFPVSWDEARAGCRERGGELVSLSPPELLVAVSKHIETKWPGHVANDYHFWVGGQKVGTDWRWLNGDELSVTSSLWGPNASTNDSSSSSPSPPPPPPPPLPPPPTPSTPI